MDGTLGADADTIVVVDTIVDAGIIADEVSIGAEAIIDPVPIIEAIIVDPDAGLIAATIADIIEDTPLAGLTGDTLAAITEATIADTEVVMSLPLMPSVAFMGLVQTPST